MVKKARKKHNRKGKTSFITEVAKRDELHTFKVIPKRWVVERSFAWLEKNRRLWKNCERLLNSSLQFTNLAFIALLLKRLRTGCKQSVADYEGAILLGRIYDDPSYLQGVYERIDAQLAIKPVLAN